MKFRSSIYVEAVLAMLLSVIGVAALSFFMIGTFNAEVTRLSDFNLQLNNKYEQYLQFSFISITLTMIFALSSAVLMIYHLKTKRNIFRNFGFLLVSLFIFTNFFSIALFNSVESIIGIKFDFQFASFWTDLYQGYAFSFFVLQSVMVALGGIALALIPMSNKMPTKSALPKTVSLLFLTVGSCIIGLSILYNSVISLLAGLGLAFWGSSLTYVSAGSYVKKEVAEATNLFYLSSFAELFNQNNHTAGVVYPSLSPKFKETDRIYPKDSNSAQSARELSKVNHFESKVNLTNYPAIGLLTLFEKTSGSKFEKTSFSNFERVIPKLLVEDLDIAQNVRIEKSENIVKIRVENPLDSTFYIEARKYPHMLNSLGTPLSGTLACALANCTKKPVAIRNHQISEDGKILEFEYALLDYSENVA